jgi:hypothetical protein
MQARILWKIWTNLNTPNRVKKRAIAPAKRSIMRLILADREKELCEVPFRLSRA